MKALAYLIPVSVLAFSLDRVLFAANVESAHIHTVLRLPLDILLIGTCISFILSRLMSAKQATSEGPNDNVR
jgi:hypothetical protein